MPVYTVFCRPHPVTASYLLEVIDPSGWGRPALRLVRRGRHSKTHFLQRGSANYNFLVQSDSRFSREQTDKLDSYIHT